ncbi:iron-sulfur cluster repair protein YtfE [Saccharospirillum salsuginis]|uniref:Iron-sulfur cluster repair protein YtfE n=1 Tax=Saccharospirillum salsuginis TaxID=418750 RepID=A0A918KM45_9GAMM|nr:iron-sulfur cluster repair protein YtfE [Saccharospirillum salsuginis]GGX66087.1 iron-sulfur cluster repair protein YtfE [Saccharospirillum salsuginis]
MTVTDTPLLNKSLADIATQVAGSTRVFRHYKLDFCCGGHLSLQDALNAKGLDAEPVLAELESLADVEPETDWAGSSRSELIDHIYNRYHLTHRQQLPELLKMARRVEAVHGNKPDCPVGLAEHLGHMSHELEGHMQKEEQILFPMLRNGLVQQAAGPIHVMQNEHDDHGEALQRLMDLTNDMTPPTGACNTWRALYAGLEALRHDLMEHIHLENNVLFKVA